MNANRTLTTGCFAAALALAAAIAGCKASDATLNTQLQAKLTSDQSLSGQSIQTSVASGVATLNGTVTSDAARSTAAGDAAQIGGIRTVVDNLVVQPSAMASAPAPGLSPVPAPPPMTPNRPSAAVPAPSARNTHMQPPPPAPQQPSPAPIVEAQPPQPPAQPAAPPPPPQPTVHAIKLPAGTAIPVRITQTLDSETTQTGDKFTGAVASDIIVDDMVVLPQGTPVTGHVDAAQDAAHFKGSSLLTISLSSISRHGERIDCATEPYSKQGEGRGKNTVEKTGGGAAVGAILGGILGGGKGAAIGAAAGGGVGAGANGITRGQQVQIPSESVVRFKLSDPIIVHVTPGGGAGANAIAGPTLEHHSDQ